jgi:circadian clock protein KaiC
LEKEKLKGLLALLRALVREHKADFLVIDGFLTVGSLAESELETKKFVHELQVLLELMGCTALLLTGASTGKEPYALRTMVDGLLHLRLDLVGMEAVRSLEVPKFRGTGMLLGRHLFNITDAGITIYPRTESRPGKGIELSESSSELAAFGIDGLDTMLGGGLRPRSIAMVLGAPGSGKTLLGLSFLAAGAKLGERGLYFGFFETPDDLRRRAEGIGLGVAGHVASGLLEIMWQSPLDAMADALAEKVLAAVRERGVKRLFIDGLGGFKDSLIYPDRSRRFFGALCSELSSLGVVTLLSEQTIQLKDIEFPEHGLTAMLDTVIGLRHVERSGQLLKFISLLKRREAGGDPSPRELSIDEHGFFVGAAETTSQAPPR